MEAQVRGARTQKNHIKGPRKVAGKPSPVSEPARRLFVSSANKRAIARFAKGPSDTGGFKYPRRRVEAEYLAPDVAVIPAPVIDNEPPFVAVSVEKYESIGEFVIVEQVVPENVSPAPVVDVPEQNDEKYYDVPTLSLEVVEPVAVQEDVSKKVDECNRTENVSKKPEAEETPDDTVGPGDSRSSESESSEEESDVETVEPVVPKIVKQVPKPTPPPSIVRKVIAPVSPVYRKSAPAPASRSSWSRFLPLVIEIKATIPYPMHLLGVFLLLVTGLLLRLLYQFGADLGGEMELQGQLIRLAKLALLFFVVAMCVNFVEDNKELGQKDPASPAQPKLRPSKLSKNKKKMMLKV